MSPTAPMRPAHRWTSDEGLSRFSTVGTPVGERTALWEEYNEAALFGLRCSTMSEQSLLATQINLELERVRLTHIAGNDHVIERTEQSIHANPVDAVMLCLLLEGEAFLYHGRGCDNLRAGDAVVYDANRPFMYGFTTTMRQVIIEVPRHLLPQESSTPDPYRPQVLRLSGNAPRAQAQMTARRVLGALSEDTARTTDTEDAILASFQVLTGSTADPHAVTLSQARAYIQTRLSEQLSVERVAREVGVSSRQLSRLFAEEGTSPSRAILQARLDLAVQLLQDPAAADLSIAQVGARVGMREPAHFSRTFKAELGMTPTECRSGGFAA